MNKLFLQNKKSVWTLTCWLLFASGSLAQTWTPKANVPLTTGIDAVNTFTINSKIYFAGGAGSKYTFEYNPTTNSWTQKADVPGVSLYRGFGVGFAIGTKGYMAMGADSGGVYLNDTWEYEASGNVWTKKADFPGNARTTSGSFVVNGKAYILGGITAANTYTNQVWEYNPATNGWAQKTNLPVNAGIAFQYTFTIGSKGYLMGGDNGGTIESNATYEYDPVNDSWTAKANYPGTPRQAGIAYVINDIAYCGLGQSQYTTMFADMHKFNPATNTWTYVGNFNGGARAWPTAAVANGKAYIGTGWDFNTFFKDWWEFTVPTGIHEIAGKENELLCYPNPTQGIIVIGNDILRPSSVRVYSMNGQLVYQTGLPQNKTINIRHLPAGEYHLELKTEEKTLHQTISLHSF